MVYFLNFMVLALFFFGVNSSIKVVFLSVLISMISFMLGVETIFSKSMIMDYVSWFMIFVVLWVFILALFPTFTYSSFQVKCLSVLALISVLFLTSSNLVVMYLLFELSMIPVMGIVFLSSLSPARFMAGWYLFLYTAGASIPLLMALLKFSGQGVSTFLYVLNYPLGWELFLMIAFLVKTPLFYCHSWLLKAHVEASLEGSIILAGILLKFGSYGIYRLKSVILIFSMTLLSKILLAVGLIGSLVGAISAFAEMDLKKVVAYSSVSHMNVSLSSFLLLKSISAKSFLCMTISHALSASVLFFMATLLYELAGSRNLIVMKSHSVVEPSWLPYVMWAWFINMSLPPSLGFISEILFLSGISSFSFFLGVLLVTGFMISSFYSIHSAVGSGLSSLKSAHLSCPILLKNYLYSWFSMIPCMLLFFTAAFMAIL
uniref:NADH-ubiquinone oxidoreductase chain 4 n=1 Tax=Pedicinus badii TaxID=430776 RepID=A0A7H1K1A9_9NEOP|nr:NADH dehydrogenase subunit 4 [Pedicinus badii]